MLTDQDVRGLNMSISDIGPKTFVAVRSDETGTIQVLHRVETQHSFIIPVFDKKTSESSEKKLTKWNSQCYVVHCIRGIRIVGKEKATYMVEGAANGLARAKHMDLAGEFFEPVTEENRHLPAEAFFGMTLDSNWNSECAVTESKSNSLNQFVEHEEFEMFYQNVDHQFVHRLGKQDLTVAIISIEEDYTKSRFDESVDLLIQHYRDVLTFRVDIVVARVGKLATDLGEVGSRLNGRPYAVIAALAASTGEFAFPTDVDYSQSKDSLMVYYLDWKKAEISVGVPTNLSKKTDESGYNHLPFVHTAHHDSDKDWLDVRTIGSVGNRAHFLQCSDLLFKSTDTTWKTPLVVHLKYTAENSYRNRSDEAMKKRKQDREEYFASSASSSSNAFRATAAASFFGSANACCNSGIHHHHDASCETRRWSQLQLHQWYTRPV